MDDTIIHTFMDNPDEESMTPEQVNKHRVTAFNKLDKIDIHWREHLFRVDTTDGETIFGALRPGYTDFLEYCFTRFDTVILWSAGNDEYVKLISERIFAFTSKQPEHVFARSFCHYDQEYKSYKKPLIKLSHEIDPRITLDNTFLVDDNELYGIDNQRNQIVIPAFEPIAKPTELVQAMETDHALYDLIAWFDRDETKGAKDVRKLSKSKIFTV